MSRSIGRQMYQKEGEINKRHWLEVGIDAGERTC